MPQPAREPDRRRSTLATIERPDADTLRLTAFWSPLSPWVYSTTLALLGAAVGALIALANGSDGDGILTLAAIAGIGGYVGGALGWALIGTIGGDVLEIRFDLRQDQAQVHQSLLWIWRRDWSFELDDVERVHHWSTRGRLYMRLSSTHFVALELAGRAPLSLGRYPTELEAMDVANPIASFLDVELEPSQPERRAT